MRRFRGSGVWMGLTALAVMAGVLLAAGYSRGQCPGGSARLDARP